MEQLDALHSLINRRSCGALKAPAPDGDALARIYQAGLRAPDHGGLQPWRFIEVREERREALGDIFAEAARRQSMDDAGILKARRGPERAPLIIVVVTLLQEHEKVPLVEQRLSAGCATMAMQYAAQLQGFNGMWRTGWLAYDSYVQQALGLSDQEEICGFLYLGTPKFKLGDAKSLPAEEFISQL